jgi:hypothetical protein
MNCNKVFGGGLYRSIRNALTPKKIAALALFSIIGSNACAQSITA